MHDFTVLVLSGASAASVAITLEMLQAAAVLSSQVKLPRPRWRILSAPGGPVMLGNGMQIESARLPQRVRADRSTWVLPGLAVTNAVDLAARLRQDDALRVVAAVRGHAGRGGAVAASCSAVFLLQAAGLLRDRTATTSWWLGPALQQLEPRCTVDTHSMLRADGPVTTAGAAFAQADLMLHLIGARIGAALADVVADVLLIERRDAQSPFVVPAMMTGGSDLVRRLTQQIERALPDPPSIGKLAASLSISTRTLARRLREATGQSPLALVQSVRLNRARMLLQDSRMTVEQVAANVGYGDATALRRLMRKATGAAPGRFRASTRRG